MTAMAASIIQRGGQVAAKNLAHMLYVEDDGGLARLLQRKLHRLGYVVDIADNGEKGLSMLESGIYDLILLDYNMPVCGGMDFLRAMEAHGRMPPVIMVTGEGNEKVAVEALKLGASDYLVKDVDLVYQELLPIVIEQVLEKEQLIRERERMLDAVRESEERYRKLVELSPDGIVIHQDGKLVFINPSGLSILGAREEHELVGRELADFIHPEFRERHFQRLAMLQDQEYLPLAEEKFLQLDQTEIDVEVITLPFFHSGEPAYQLIFRDITERKEARQRLEFMATCDALTTLPNRLLFSDRLSQARSNAKRYSRSFALLFVDLDRFKAVNDNFGHDVGDMLLREVADRLSGCVGEADTLARMGGDEFCILLLDIAGKQDAARVARKITAILCASIRLRGHECRVRASIGISIFPDDSEDPETLLKMSDTAMYRAKEQGRNTYCFFGDGGGTA
jgi:diguanylate cyclase (GGDEF)-like protein/PAS domain S-box-containing protein